MFLEKSIRIGLTITVGLAALLSTACNRSGKVILTAPEVVEETQAAEQEYLVKRRGLAYLDGDSAFEEKYGVTIIKKIPAVAIDIVKLEDNGNLEQLSKDPAIEYVEPNYIRRMKIQPAADVSTTAGTASIIQSGIPKANSIYRGMPFITVAVVSTGIDSTHPDLKNKVVTGFSSFGEDDSTQDINGAGTHQAGVIAASNSASGIYGVAPNCKVMPVKAMNEDGEGKDGDLIQGISWAIDHGANVVTFTAEGEKPSRAFDDVIKYAYTKKVPLIVGSGDKGENTQSFPAASKGVIAVNSLGSGNDLASSSNSGNWISVSAPGQNIRSTSSTKISKKMTATYAVLSGSSVAAAYVAGEIALLKSKFPTLDMVGLRKHLELTSDDLGAPGADDSFGFGRINVAKALMINPPGIK
jgi:subtilisin family serine protease